MKVSTAAIAAHGDDEAVFLANAAREYDGRQAPDQHPGGPVERPANSEVAPRPHPPLRAQVQRRKLEVDGQIDAEPEKCFDERISFVEIIEAVAGAYCGYRYQPDAA